MDNLTLEVLAPYLPYGLQMSSHGRIYILNGFILESAINVQDKPILHPLSEYKNINSKLMNGINTDLGVQIEIWDLANKRISFQSLSYETAMECFRNHIDIFGLIEKNLAIDINSIEGKETKGNG